MFVCGEIGCGKDYYIRHNLSDYLQISTHDAVTSIIHSNKRSTMQDTIYLDDEITKYIIKKIYETNKINIVVSGIRQKSIMMAIISAFPLFKLTWVYCPVRLRKQRFLDRNNKGKRTEDISFEQAELNEKKLGILDLYKFMKSNGFVNIIKGY